MARLRNRRMKQNTALVEPFETEPLPQSAATARRWDRVAAAPSALALSTSFLETLRRYRDHCDRDGRNCSLLLFSLPPNLPRDDHTLLIAVLSWHLRAGDTIGEWGSTGIGVILPDLPSTAGRVIARGVCDQFAAERNYELRYAIHVYPYSQIADALRCDGNGHFHATPPDRPMEPLFAQSLPLWKRTMDVLGATAGLLLLSPLFLVVSLLIKITSPGPILFRQKREGLGGRCFMMLKFRSMVPDAESQRHGLHALNERDGPAFKIRNDPRTTRLGRLLRRTGLDEIPQLCNVLKGDMSLVGPRPLPVAESQACLQWQRRRLDVTPGMTCIWQARGGLHVSFDDWMRMDLEYVEHHGFWTDVVLLAQTAWRVVLLRASH